MDVKIMAPGNKKKEPPRKEAHNIRDKRERFYDQKLRR
jgi:hypothetical protein